MKPLMQTYSPQDISFERGEGAWLFDANGNSYLDGITGVAVCGLGHAHPAVTRAIAEQAGKLLHTSNHFQIKQQQLLAERLTSVSGMDNVFFCNSGAEANEAAIKLARLYGNTELGAKLPSIVVTEGAFHGRTMATLSATGNRKIQKGFEPLVTGFVRAPYNDLDALQTIAKNNPDIAAIMVEPIQGENGIRVPEPGYLRGLRELCDAQNWLLMLDEIQSGNGRSGSFFAYQQEGISPDVVTTAKGLANGVPIGACLARGKAAATLTAGSHGSTFGGNPLASAAALAVIDEIENKKLAQRAAELGEYFKREFEPLIAKNLLTEVRVSGLLIGLDLGQPAAGLLPIALKHGLLINTTAETVLRLLPPLILNDEEAEQLVERVIASLSEFYASLEKE